MKIVVLGTRGFPNVQGGVETHCEELYSRLVKLGCEVVVLARAPYVGAKEYSYKGVTVKPLACPKYKFLEAFAHTRMGVYEAKKLRPDIVHIHAIGPSFFVPLARALGMKVVMTHHGPDYMRAKWNWFARMVLRFGEKRGCYNADEIICISGQIYQDVKRKFRREGKVIPNGVVLPEIAQSDEALKRYGLEKGKYVLAVGRFVPEKGLGDLMGVDGEKSEKKSDSHKKRDSHFFPGNDKWKLVIVGAADHEDSFSRQLKAAKNADIVLTGFLSGPPLQELYSHAGLFVLPSYYEGLPIVLLEAMSYGLSCIVSDIPANREVGLSEERYFKAGDIEGLSLKIKEFAAKPMPEEEKSRQIGLLRQKYDWDKIAAETLKVYQGIK